jgi:hypothetical protein
VGEVMKDTYKEDKKHFEKLKSLHFQKVLCNLGQDLHHSLELRLAIKKIIKRDMGLK